MLTKKSTYEHAHHGPVRPRQTSNAELSWQRVHDVQECDEAGRFHSRPRPFPRDVKARIDGRFALGIPSHEPLDRRELRQATPVSEGMWSYARASDLQEGRTAKGTIQAPSSRAMEAASFEQAPCLGTAEASGSTSERAQLKVARLPRCSLAPLLPLCYPDALML